MARFAVLLRGINVGGNKRVAMADLRQLLSGLGFTDVQTLLQSGNAVFGCRRTKPEALARRIEGAIRDELGLDVACIVRSQEEMQAVIAGNPLPQAAKDGSKFLVVFLSRPPDPERLAEHDPVELFPDRIRLGDRVIYQWCPDGILAAPAAGGFAEKYLSVTTTGRNWNTVTKLGALLGG
ncbi:MAG TPA: DUF1697 domain-containing protein [Acidimicrobiales bacterium]|nr:DUF1697 domain-containing protein [Acidimicrobiales bacterium]